METMEVAKGISEYGLMVMISAIYLALTATAFIAVAKWVKAMFEKMLNGFSEQLTALHATLAQVQETMNDVAEGLAPETRLRIENTCDVNFALSTEQVCKIIKRVREENHIVDKEATKEKIRTMLSNIYEQRINRFESYRYRGKLLSAYCSNEWIERVAKVVEAELYNQAGANDNRAYTNVKAVYDSIKNEFYHKLNG